MRGPPRICFIAYYMEAPSYQFLRILYGAPQICFFAYYMGPLLSVALLTIWGPLRSVFSHTMCGSLQTCFFAYYMGDPQIILFVYNMEVPSDQFLRILYGGPLRLIYSHTISYGGPLRHVFSHFIWGPPQVSFFA